MRTNAWFLLLVPKFSRLSEFVEPFASRKAALRSDPAPKLIKAQGRLLRSKALPCKRVGTIPSDFALHLNAAPTL
ncbi:hypothetical protein BJV74DRAFT_803308 [Russula compacta]|nr:hypothetical protein BJV74DRAFT_803308 [Russula compacta]